jgi:hypothetical protein
VLEEQTWALISQSVTDEDVAWLESVGIEVENLDQIYEHDFLLLTTYTERQVLLLKLKYSHDKLVNLAVREDVSRRNQT